MPDPVAPVVIVRTVCRVGFGVIFIGLGGGASGQADLRPIKKVPPASAACAAACFGERGPEIAARTIQHRAQMLRARTIFKPFEQATETVKSVDPEVWAALSIAPPSSDGIETVSHSSVRDEL